MSKSKKPGIICPPGIICLESATLAFIVCIILVTCVILYSITNSSSREPRTPAPQHRPTHTHDPSPINMCPMAGWTSWPNFNTNIFNRFRPNVFMDPYAPPLNDMRYPVLYPPLNRAINVSTNVGATNAEYRQTGILTSLNSNSGGRGILPLMGRPVFVNRNKWQYYTMSNQQNSVKLPISVNGRSAMNEYGVDRIENGDTVYVEGVNEPHSATIYDTNTIQYML